MSRRIANHLFRKIYVRRYFADYLLSTVGLVMMPFSLLVLTESASIVAMVMFGLACAAFSFSFSVALGNFEGHSKHLREQFSDDFHLQITFPAPRSGVEYENEFRRKRTLIFVLLAIGGALFLAGLFVS